MTVLTILSVPVWALNVDLAWSLSLDNVYNGSEVKQVLLSKLNNHSTVTRVNYVLSAFHNFFENLFWRSDSWMIFSDTAYMSMNYKLTAHEVTCRFVVEICSGNFAQQLISSSVSTECIKKQHCKIEILNKRKLICKHSILRICLLKKCQSFNLKVNCFCEKAHKVELLLH